MYSKQINKYLHFKRLASRAVSVLYVLIPHLGLLFQKCDAFHLHRIHVCLRLHPIAKRDERSSDSICHMIMGCQHNLPGEGKLHFNGDAPWRCSAPSSDIWQWGGGGVEASLWGDSISASPSPNSIFFPPAPFQ